MIREVLQVGDPVLRKTCEKVTRFDEKLCGLLDDLKDTLFKEEGAGLAAPQIGVSLRVFVVNVDEGYFEFVNPVFVWQKGDFSPAPSAMSTTTSTVSSTPTRPQM